MFTKNIFAITLILITMLAMLGGLVSIWVPQFMTPEMKWKLVWTFVTISASVAVVSYVMQYLSK